MTTLGIVLLVIAGVVVLASVARGVTAYRSSMRRKWPEVQPRNDDDD
jgi:hypothetical protein